MMHTQDRRSASAECWGCAAIGASSGFPPLTTKGDHCPLSSLTGFFSFSLMALLYLVTEELLADAHCTPDKPWAAAMLFVGFLLLITLDELLA